MKPALRRSVVGLLLASLLAGAAQAEDMAAPQAEEPATVPAPPSLDAPAADAGTAPTRKVFARGLASWYSPRLHGRKTASGERFDVEALTAAHRSLPLGTWVEVHNPANGQRVTVRINDRGPHVRGVLIDLSPRAAQILGLLSLGRGRVQLSRVSGPTL